MEISLSLSLSLFCFVPLCCPSIHSVSFSSLSPLTFWSLTLSALIQPNGHPSLSLSLSLCQSLSRCLAHPLFPRVSLTSSVRLLHSSSLPHFSSKLKKNNNRPRPPRGESPLAERGRKGETRNEKEENGGVRSREGERRERENCSNRIRGLENGGRKEIEVKRGSGKERQRNAEVATHGGYDRTLSMSVIL